MNKIRLFKVVLVVVLSVLLVMNLTSVVFAADDLTTDWENAGTPVDGSASTGTTGTDSTTGTTGTDSTTGTTTGIETSGTTSTDTTGTSTTTTDSTSSISTGSATTTLSTNEDENEDESKNEVNSLAYTGIEDNTVLPVVIVIGAVVAGYSLKKLRDYNNI